MSVWVLLKLAVVITLAVVIKVVWLRKAQGAALVSWLALLTALIVLATPAKEVGPGLLGVIALAGWAALAPGRSR